MTDSPKKPLVIVGSGETAILAYEYFTHDSDYEVVAFAVDAAYRDSDRFLEFPLVDVETIETHFPPEKYDCHVAISATQLNRPRARLFTFLKEKGYHCASYISSHAFVWHNVSVGENVFIFEDNTIQPFCKIGDNVVLWSGNHIGHRTVIDNHCFIASHVVISGFCEVGEYSFIGVNTTVGDHIKIAKDNFIAMGALITKNTEENKIYEGHPAQPRKISATRFCRVKE